ncbi:OmpA family protein [Rhodophyticola sp. CCM32]|uniref:OmpA family protein n=1 Tax=Rhodophyticola sp. CCM32 TaxID=2916397 RepID=UPI00107F9F0E|nr:OmpA family protein [Rhodophyticola sp. CCM32]QBY01949.1 OmpA family protein [Rhodophyticola sp. CCM32]
MTHLLRLTVLLLCFAAPAFAQDVAGSADHPLVGRFDGSTIRSYETQEFDEVHVARTAGEVSTVEGAVTRLSYAYPAETSLLQITRNFEIALEDRGFDILLSCDQDDCGRINYDVEQFGNSPSWADAFNYRYVMASRTGPESTAHVSLFLSVNNRNTYSVVTVTEEEAMAIRMIDAAEMQSSIGDTGRVALYGITFDTDQATIRPESAPTIAEMGAFLATNPDVRVVIVGHTDNQGAMAYNLALSAQRAEAVVAALRDDHGIEADRMAHAGAGFLAPVAVNTTAEGRALNRRVEMIAR